MVPHQRYKERTSILTYSGRKVVFLTLALGWLFIVTFTYYIVHKPFTATNLIALGSAAADIGIYLLLFLLAAAIGQFYLRTLTFDSPIEKLILSGGFGFTVLALASFTFGLAGMLNPLVFWGALGVGLILWRNEIMSIVRQFSAPHFSIANRFEGTLAAFVALTLLLAVTSAMTPPLAWDAQVYHLTEGKYWIAMGGISGPPDVPYFSFPSLGEMVYMAALLLKGDTLTQLIHWGFFALTVGLTLVMGRNFFSSRIGWVAAALLCAVPSLALIASWAYVDAVLLFFSTAALYATLKAIDEMHRHPQADSRWLLLGGAFAGMAMGSKYTALIVPLTLLLLIARPSRAALQNSFRYSMAAILVALPWYARNFIYQDNPIYPFFFGGPFWDSFRNAQFGRFGSGLIEEPLRLLIAPWEATILGQEGALTYEATIGPLLLAFLPLIFLTSAYRSTTARRIVVYCAGLFAFWLFGDATSKLLLQTRLLFPAFPAFALLAALSFDRLAELDFPSFSFARFARFALVLVLGLTLFGQALEWVDSNPLAFIAGYESRVEYLTQRLAPQGFYDALQHLNRLPAGSRTYFLWEPRSYYAPDVTVVSPDALLDHFGDLQFRYGTADAIASALQREGYTHILLNRAGLNYYVTTQYDPIPPAELALLGDFLARHAQIVVGWDDEGLKGSGEPALKESDAYVLYRLLPSANP